MINEVLVSVGIAMMAYSIVVSGTITSRIGSEGVRRYWRMLSVLMVFFLLGYIAFLLAMVFPGIGFSIDNSLVSVIFMFGAGFVLLVMKLSDSIIGTSVRNNMELRDVNKDLRATAAELEKKKEDLDRQREDLNRKNRDLEETLEDFYTLRMSLEGGMKSGSVAKENREIKKRLDRVRKR